MPIKVDFARNAAATAGVLFNQYTHKYHLAVCRRVVVGTRVRGRVELSTISARAGDKGAGYSRRHRHIDSVGFTGVVFVSRDDTFK